MTFMRNLDIVESYELHPAPLRLVAFASNT
jgi:hypothetical protein